MKKIISTIVAIGLTSALLVNNSYAGGRHGIDPIWVPVAVVSTIAALAIAQAEPVVYERRVYREPRPIIIREHDHRHHRHGGHGECDRDHESRRHHHYR